MVTEYWILDVIIWEKFYLGPEGERTDRFSFEGFLSPARQGKTDPMVKKLLNNQKSLLVLSFKSMGKSEGIKLSSPGPRSINHDVYSMVIAVWSRLRGGAAGRIVGIHLGL